jgi:hypothetical protein
MRDASLALEYSTDSLAWVGDTFGTHLQGRGRELSCHSIEVATYLVQ